MRGGGRSWPAGGPLAEETEQVAVVRDRGVDGEPVDAGGAEPALQLLMALRRAARDLALCEVDEPRLPRLDVAQPRQPQRRKAVLAGIEERDGDEVVTAHEAPHRT